MTIFDMPVAALDGTPTSLQPLRGKVLLAVNVASRCGYTPQYAELQELHVRYEQAGFSVLGFPCNQFLFQEPGGPDAITACSVAYGVTFPVFEKLKVNGPRQHPLYAMLTTTPDDRGRAGRVRWNFEKFLIDRDGRPLHRYRTKVTPSDPMLVAAIETALTK